MIYQIIIKELVGSRKRAIFEVKTHSIEKGIEKVEEKFQSGR